MKARKLYNRIMQTILIASMSLNALTSYAAAPGCAITATAFATSDNGDVNNVQVQWSKQKGSSYTVYRASSEYGPWEQVYNGTGASMQDSNLGIGDYYYKVVRNDGAETDITKVTTYNMPSNLRDYNNVTGSSMHGVNEIYHDGTYYSYRYVNDSNGMQKIDEYTSRDGVNYSFHKTVLYKSDAQELADCKLEALNFRYSPEQNKVILWAHYEKAKGYGEGKALVATMTPGDKFTIHRVFNPFDIEVRDMNLFLDDDGTGYLVAASNKHGQGANRTLYIFELTEDYTNAKRVVKTLFDNQYREAPAVVKHDGFYYIFTSQAAGWYPSTAKYCSATSMDGEWSELRDIGNTSTFSCQSGGISSIGEGSEKQHFIMANRWIRGEGTASQVALPLFMNNGYAFTDYFTNIKYNTSNADFVPVQKGELLSQDKYVQSNFGSASGYDISRLVDGDYNTEFKANQAKWPCWVQVDLGEVCDLTNIQISWFICKGSEGYYRYNVQASDDGKNWKIVANNTNPNDTKVTKTYGFNVNTLNGSGRYVRVNIESATLQNNPNNWYTPTIYEMKIYGNRRNPALKPTTTPSPSQNPSDNKFITTAEAEVAYKNGVDVSTSKGGYSGNGYVTGFDNTSDNVEFTVTVPKSGDYHINTRYASEYADKYTNLSVNGNNIGDKLLKQSSKFTDAYLDTVYLNQGENKIKLSSAWGWYDIDNITVQSVDNIVGPTVTPAPTATPAPTQQPVDTSKVTVEAETGYKNGVEVSTSRWGYSGNGYITGFDNASDSLELTVNVASAGEYYLNTQYASEYGDKSTKLIVNGNEYGEKMLKQTSKFSDAYLDTVYLNQGENKIKLESNWGWYDIDNITLTKK